jgi:hypothetical protein
VVALTVANEVKDGTLLPSLVIHGEHVYSGSLGISALPKIESDDRR